MLPAPLLHEVCSVCLLLSPCLNHTALGSMKPVLTTTADNLFGGDIMLVSALNTEVLLESESALLETCRQALA